MTTDQAIKMYGAKRVHDAALARLKGNPAPLAAVGLTAAGIGQADAIMSAAYKRMTQSQQDNDYWGALDDMSDHLVDHP